MASVPLLQREVVMFAPLCSVKDGRCSLAAENGLSLDSLHPLIGFFLEYNKRREQFISVLGVFRENV